MSGREIAVLLPPRYMRCAKSSHDEFLFFFFWRFFTNFFFLMFLCIFSNFFRRVFFSLHFVEPELEGMT